jgi:hypothetical protein
MKLVIIKEVEYFIFRAHVSKRAKYYGVVFLSQMVLLKSEGDVCFADAIIGIVRLVVPPSLTYHHRVVLCCNRAPLCFIVLHHDRSSNAWSTSTLPCSTSSLVSPMVILSMLACFQQSWQVLHTLLSTPLRIAALSVVYYDARRYLLTPYMGASLQIGLNRAIPFLGDQTAQFDQHIDTLFRISHTTTFNKAVQALYLIFQLMCIGEVGLACSSIDCNPVTSRIPQSITSAANRLDDTHLLLLRR